MSSGAARHSSRTIATREKLYVSASLLVGERGVDQVTVEEIAAHAGVAKGTVYYNFPSKELLIEGLLQNRLQSLLGELAQIDSREPTEAIGRVVETITGFVEQNVSLSQLVVAEMWRSSSRWHDLLGRVRGEIIEAIQRIVERADAAEHRNAGPRTVAVGLLSTCLTAGLDWQVYSPDRARGEIKDEIVRLFAS